MIHGLCFWRCTGGRKISSSAFRLSTFGCAGQLPNFAVQISCPTEILFECTFLIQVKRALSWCFLSLFFNFFQFGFTWPDSYAAITFVLFVIHASIAFFFTLYSSATLFVLFPSSIFYNNLYFSVIEMFTLFILTKFTTVQDFVVQQKV